MENRPQLPRFKQALLIDDDEVDNYISHRVLKSISFAEHIEIKSSAADALHYVKSLIEKAKQLPDIIFLDISMPGMDGFNFLDAFMQLPTQASMNPRIIVLTNSEYFDHPRMKISATHKIIHTVLQKPLCVEALQKIYS